MYLKKIKLTVLLGIGLSLSACTFHPRSPMTIPTQMQTLYLESDNPYSPLNVALRRYLAALQIHWVKKPTAAPLSLHILRVDWEETTYPLLYSGNATTYNYTLHVTLSLETRDSKTIAGPHTLSISRALTKNVNQIYTPNASIFMKQELIKTMVVLIYYYLISDQVRHALQTLPRHNYKN